MADIVSDIMVDNWWKYVLVGIGAYIVGAHVGKTDACENPYKCYQNRFENMTNYQYR